MNYRTFGRTGWQVSEIAFGAWQLGGTWGAVDEKESIDTLLYAFEEGINLADTAVLYGNGKSESESTIGKALSQWRGEVDLNTAYSDGRPFPAELRDALRPYAWKHRFY